MRYREAACDHFVHRCYFADLMWVSPGGRVLEVEVKTSLADWRADLDKGKWGRMPRWVARFVYAVPEALGMPPWVPEAAGVWRVRGDGHVRVARAPHVLGREKVPPAIAARWRDELYVRYWMARLYQRHLPRADDPHGLRAHGRVQGGPVEHEIAGEPDLEVELRPLLRGRAIPR